MTTKRSFAALALVLSLAVPGAFAQKSADPLTSFKKVVAACEAHVRALPPESAKQLKTGEWAHNFHEITSIAHDVKRTDSLVSPFTAYIRVESLSYVVRKPSEDEARAVSKQERSISRGIQELRYAFQDSKLKLMNGTSRHEFKLAGQTSFSDHLGEVEVSAGEIASNSRWSGCLP
ncbi:hypothetical protein [Delftia lacustris]|uniref:hypothetical protein n=1 Tax=Delftia lacustris TaxID=558537 RepID=UPI002D78EB49|nr:hypothetical protein [Delftia lacustris]